MQKIYININNYSNKSNKRYSNYFKKKTITSFDITFKQLMSLKGRSDINIILIREQWKVNLLLKKLKID